MKYQCYSCSEKQKKSKSGGNAENILGNLAKFAVGKIPFVGDNIVNATGLDKYEADKPFFKTLQNIDEKFINPALETVGSKLIDGAIPGLGTAISTVDNIADDAQGVGKDKKTGKSLNGINPLDGSRYAQTGGQVNSVKKVDGGTLNKISSTGIKAEGRLHEDGGININDEIEIEGGEGIHKLGNKTVISSDTLEDEDGYTFAEKMTELEAKKGYLENRLKIEEEKGNKNTVIVLKKKIAEIDNEIKELYGKQELTAKEMGLRDKNGNPNQASQDIVPSPENPNPPGMLGKFGGSFKFRKRYQTAGETDFNTKWVNSSRHDEMLKNSIDKSGDGTMYEIDPKTGTKTYIVKPSFDKTQQFNNIKSERKDVNPNIEYLDKSTDDFDVNKHDGLATMNNETSEQKIYVNNNISNSEKIDNINHETSHLSDRFGKNIPASDKDLVNKHANANNVGPYYAKPTEVRARLNTVRNNLNKNYNIDVFNEQVTKEQLQQYINDNIKSGNIDKNLNDLYQDYGIDATLEMMNTISYNNSNSNNIAKFGGKFKFKYQGGSGKDFIKDPNKPGDLLDQMNEEQKQIDGDYNFKQYLKDYNRDPSDTLDIHNAPNMQQYIINNEEVYPNTNGLFRDDKSYYYSPIEEKRVADYERARRNKDYYEQKSKGKSQAASDWFENKKIWDDAKKNKQFVPSPYYPGQPSLKFGGKFKFQVAGNSELKFKQLSYKTPKNKPIYQGDDGLYYELKSDGTYANYTEGLRQGNDNIPPLATPPIVEYPKPKTKGYQSINAIPTLYPTSKSTNNRGYIVNSNYNRDTDVENKTAILSRLNSYNVPFIETTPVDTKKEIVKVPVVVNNDNNTNNNNSKNKDNRNENNNYNTKTINMSKITEKQLAKILENLKRIGNLKNPAQIAKFGGMKKRQIGGTASGATTTGASESSGFMDMLPNLLGSLGNMGSKKEEQPVPQQQPMYPPIVINNAVPETKPYFDQNQFAYDRMKLQNEMNYGRAKSGGDWIKDATNSIEKRGTEGRCSGSNFGGPDCPPGSRQYNLAVTFKKMAKREMGGLINKTGYLKGHSTNKNPYNIIPSNIITTKGMKFPIEAVSDTGDKKILYPNQKEKVIFKGNYVVEKPLKAQNGLGMKKPYDPFKLNPPLIPPVPKNMFPPVAPPPSKWDKFKGGLIKGTEITAAASPAIGALIRSRMFKNKGILDKAPVNEIVPDGFNELKMLTKNLPYNMGEQNRNMLNSQLQTQLMANVNSGERTNTGIAPIIGEMNKSNNQAMIALNQGMSDNYGKIATIDEKLKESYDQKKNQTLNEYKLNNASNINDVVEAFGKFAENANKMFSVYGPNGKVDNEKVLMKFLEQYPWMMQDSEKIKVLRDLMNKPTSWNHQ